MKKIHYTDRYLLNPHHPVTVFVIGAGGTGSQVATNLARMSIALQALGHPGLHLTVFDPDTVTEANIGRQLFSESEARTEQGGGTCNPYQPLFRLFMGSKRAMLSVRNIRFRFGEYHHHLHGHHPFTDRSVAFFEKT